MKRAPVIAGVVAVVLAGLVTLFAFSPNDAERREAAPLVGKPAPPITATTISGERFDLDALRGGWVVVNFFATWCGPCKVEQPELIKFAQRHAGSDFVVSISLNEGPAAAKKFFEANGGDWPVIAQGNGSIALDYGVIRLPESYIVDPDGIVVAKFNGGVTAAGLDRVIQGSRAPAGGGS